MNIKIKNFGPISSADIDLKPLTIFVGPNMSGKSYAATLIHALLKNKSYQGSMSGDYLMFSGHRYPAAAVKRIINRNSSIGRFVNFLKGRKSTQLPNGVINPIEIESIKLIYEHYFSDELSRLFSSSISDLSAIGKKPLNLTVKIKEQEIFLKYSKKNIKFVNSSNFDTEVSLEKIINKNRSSKYILNSNIGLKVEGFFPGNIADIEGIVTNILDICIQNNVRKLKTYASNSYLLPAGRSGLLNVYNSLLLNLITKSSAKSGRTPSLSGIISDILYLLSLNSTKIGQYHNIAIRLENEILKGKIEIKKFSKYSIDEINYRFYGANIPMNRASSTVTELAPIILYIKHIIEKGNLLIIEEPEAHLHPENQRILAKYIVRLVRAGVKILITTHSDFLISQINDFMLLRNVSEQKRKAKYHYDKNDYLDYEKEVAAYVFSYDKNFKGFKTSPIQITEEDGISQDEFLRIHESLYEESFKLRNQ
jgi:predicted ATPase